ncbi:AlpA family transcriptional regulator [Caulobacter segnis]|uniref:DNA-binding protein n=1 Tax=Caulobacter segnis TaxID=88688 RepID=A0A2W5XFW7_9CAUL|nr:helix-turn-helix domain-containing protein [Caulobacter segnis]PZR36651.1 MAG: DNA-binding protein [Caulobacter segnis]
MSLSDGTTPPRHLKTAEAARFLGLSDRTMEKHRCYGTGPVYRKIGGRVVYTLDDLQAWSQRGARISTKEAAADVVLPAKLHAAITPPDAADESDPK